MAAKYNRRINLYINGKEVSNNIKSVSGAMSKLRGEQRQMTIGSKEYLKHAEKIKYLKKIVDKHNASLRGTTSAWGKMTKMAKGFLPAIGATAIVAGLGRVIRKMNDAAKAADNFEERLDNLSALTGLEGRALEELGETAKQTSAKITKGGVRIKQSADDIVDAYTKVGSQRPELLKNGEALASVTEDAIILSEAAKSELEPAVAGLTTTMNQFNLGADQSRRIINAMAAGSKEGAADIPYITEAIEKSGTTLNLMNVSLEENIGLIEAIAPKYAKAQLAGNSLDKVFLKLQEKQIGYTNGLFNVNDALDELAARYKSGESAASIFGVEHAKMGTLLVQNKDEFNRYTKAVTGTNVAIEQAAKNTNNAKAIQEQYRNELHNLSIALGEKISPAMQQFYKIAGLAASALTRMVSVKASDKLKEDRIEMNNLFTAIKRAKEGSEARKLAIDQLNKTYGKYLPNLLSEKSTLTEIAKAQRIANSELIKNIQIKLREEELEGLARKQKKIMDNILRDVEKQRGKSLTTAAESEIFTLLDEMASMKSADEARNRLGAFAKVYRDASRNVGTYTENLKQFFELFKIRGDQQTLLDRINKIATTPNDAPFTENGSNNNKPTDKETTSPLDALLNADAETQKTVMRKYFADAGKDSFEAFIAAIEKEAAKSKIDWSLVPETEEEDEFDPATDYAIQKYQQTLDFKLALNESMYEQGLIGEQEYQDKLTELTRQAEDERFEIKREKIEDAKAIANMATNFVTALMDLELTNAGDNEEKKKQIRKKYADLNFAVTASQIVANTAGAIMQGFAQLGPIAGIIAAALLGATGAVQLGVANAERNKVKGFAAGGYTNGERMYVAGEAGTEWIAPNWMTNNPATAPIISSLESFRNNRISLNPDIIPMFAEGGYTTVQEKMSNLNKFQNTPLTSGIDQLQNEILTELVGRIGNSLDKNTQAIQGLTDKKTYVAVEDIRKADKLFTKIELTSGL